VGLRILDFRFWIDSTDKSGGLYHQEILVTELGADGKFIDKIGLILPIWAR